MIIVWQSHAIRISNMTLDSKDKMKEDYDILEDLRKLQEGNKFLKTHQTATYR